MLKGIALGFASYGAFSGGDAFIKTLGGRLPVFEITFFITMFAMVALPFARPRTEPWREMFRINRPWLVLLRALSATAAGFLGVTAFTTLPFAEAYALIFLSPLVATVLSYLLLREPVGWRRMLAVFVGLAGVLLVVRPGFRELLPGHFAAAGVAVCSATTVILLRVLGPTEKRITLMGMALLVPMVVNGVILAFVFVAPTARDLMWLAAAGLASGCAHILLMAATRAAPASRIAPGQYSQILWAVILGALVFGEFPDRLAMAGMALVAISGLFTFMRERKLGIDDKELTLVGGRTPRSGGRV